MNVNRRQLVTGLLGAGVGAAAAGSLTTYAASRHGLLADRDAPVPFDGPHQAGITTPAPDRLHFAAFDVTTTDKAALVALLKTWTDAARQLTAGREVGDGGAFGGAIEAPPADTGEAAGLAASGLTLTIGFGPTLFEHPEHGDRFGLAAQRPAALADLPHFPADNLDPARSGGDLCIQACANDAQVAAHAIRNLARLAFGTATLRWSQLGFGRTSATTAAQGTPRNLFGQKDGTHNIRAEDADLLKEHVWARAADGADWMAGGSYLVARRIRMHIETWDRTPLAEQELIVGRHKGSGAPLTGQDEFEAPDFSARKPDGSLVIDENSHVRLAHPDANGGVHLLRRGYSFIDGNDDLGRMDAGLFFIAFQRDPRTGFVAVQRRLARHDLMHEYLQHVGSGVFAVPPGVRPGGYWGQSLFGSPAG